MIKISNIKPLTDFVRNSKAHIQHLRETESPEILTVNGEAAVVVKDAASYGSMAALAEQPRQEAGVQSALNHYRGDGKGSAADDVLSELDKKYR